MKILLTDDESQVRKGLRMKVNWEDEGFHIVGEARNGQEALDFLAKEEVDVVFTDVRMPIMDGIELAKRCHMNYPHIKVVVLSGYSDYEYIRSSMIEGVKDYLLKPVAPDEITEVLNRIRTEIVEERKKQLETERISLMYKNQLVELREQYLLYLVKEEWSELNMARERLQQLQLDEFGNEKIQVQFMSVEIRGLNRNPKDLRLPFKMLCREIAQGFKGTYSFYDSSYANMIHFIHSVEANQVNNISSLVMEVQRHAKEFMNLETVIGIGRVVTGLTEFRTGYISALLSWSQSQLGSYSQVLDETSNKAVVEITPGTEEKLINAIENVNFLAYKENLNSILIETKNQSVISFSFVTNRILFLLSSLARKYNLVTVEINKIIWYCQQSIWELNSQDKVKEHLIQLAEMIIRKVQEDRTSTNGAAIVENVRRYLDQHYASEISLTLLADQFHINSAYLSEIFKHNIGQNFSDYLNNLRMEKAKQFLEDYQLKIIDVAHLVGFANSGYFSTVFKKHYGQTPVEYRKSIN